MLFELVPRLDVAHETCANMVAALRDPATTIYTGPAPEPSGPGEKTQSAEGWVRHLSSEPARLMSIKDATGGAFARNFPEQVQAEADYQTAMPILQGLVQAAIDIHGRNEPLTQQECNDLADALAAQMEP